MLHRACEYCYTFSLESLKFSCIMFRLRSLVCFSVITHSDYAVQLEKGIGQSYALFVFGRNVEIREGNINSTAFDRHQYASETISLELNLRSDMSREPACKFNVESCYLAVDVKAERHDKSGSAYSEVNIRFFGDINKGHVHVIVFYPAFLHGRECSVSLNLSYECVEFFPEIRNL